MSAGQVSAKTLMYWEGDMWARISVNSLGLQLKEPPRSTGWARWPGVESAHGNAALLARWNPRVSWDMVSGFHKVNADSVLTPVSILWPHRLVAWEHRRQSLLALGQWLSCDHLLKYHKNTKASHCFQAHKFRRTVEELPCADFGTLSSKICEGYHRMFQLL